MSTLAAEAQKIRNQLSAAPNRKTFRKTRQTLLEIAIMLEVADKALRDLEQDLQKCKETPLDL